MTSTTSAWTTTPRILGWISAITLMVAIVFAAAWIIVQDVSSRTARATTSGESRIWAGIHFRSDVTTGQAIARVQGNDVLNRDATSPSGVAAGTSVEQQVGANVIALRANDGGSAPIAAPLRSPADDCPGPRCKCDCWPFCC